MPKGPKGEKRPADAVAAAVMIAKLATGEMVETLPKRTQRTKSGKAGAKARAKALTPAQRSAIAKKAAASRWGNRTSK